MKRKKPFGPRGFDFLARWSQGAWAESKVIETINASGFLAVHYGPSRGDPMSYGDFSAWKKFFEEFQQKLETCGKRPDLLVFRRESLEREEDRDLVFQLQELDDERSSRFVHASSIALEVETSLWKAKKALALGRELSFTVKEEDMDRLTQWQRAYDKQIVITQVFYDSAYAISYDKVKQLVAEGRVKKTKDRKTGKLTYNVPLSFGEEFASSVQMPSVEPRVLENERGLVMAFAVFKGGRFELTERGLRLLRST